MDKEKLKKNYEDACNAYLKAFCKKHDFYFSEAFWVGDDVGGIVDCNGGYDFDMATIRTDIDEDAPEEELIKWYDYIVDAMEFKLPTPNFHAWIHGCPRTSEAWFKDMRKMKEDFENAIKDEKDKNKF